MADGEGRAKLFLFTGGPSKRGFRALKWFGVDVRQV